MKSKIVLVLMAMIMITGLFIAGCAKPAPAPAPTPAPTPAPKEPKVLKAICNGSLERIYNKTRAQWIDMVAEYSDGQLVIDFIGEREVMDEEEMPFALQKGVVDIAMLSGTAASNGWPIGLVMDLTGMTPWEEREAGVWDFYRETLARDLNAYWTAHTLSPMWWRIGSNVAVRTPGEFKGVKIRGAANTVLGIEAIGAVPVRIPSSEIYTAIERGVVDAFVFPPVGWIGQGWHEVIKYVVGPELLHGQNTCNLINMDLWKSLSDEEKGWLMNPLLDNEREFYDFNVGIYGSAEDGEAALRNAGIEFIEMSAADAESVANAFKRGIWDSAADKIPENDRIRFAELIGMK